MKRSIFLLLISFNIGLCLKGSLESICYISVRMEQLIEVGPEQYQTIYNIVPEERCCPSYHEQGDICLPTCEPPCKNGSCIEPNVCSCTQNYTGPLCENLICSIGYEGPNCDKKCSLNRYGQDCQNNCTCENGYCNHRTGYCSCNEGWSGYNCSVKCPDDLFCLNDGVCNFENKQCICQPGYTGQHCEKICEQNLWGDNCTQSCNCDENYICDPTNGECKYNCINGEYYEGTCWCNKGWTGESCTEKLCPTGFYGVNCDKKCLCEMKTTKMCVRDTGACDCKPGWKGDDCRESCPYMIFGQGCNKSCECIDGHHDGCDAVSGMCKCIGRYTGETCNKLCTCENGVCDSYGNCICSSGWQGRNCDEKCSEGYYGDGCSELCALCADAGYFACHHIRGPICAPGYTGPHCTEPCPDGTYGTDCKNCTCASHFLCNRFTGACECSPGWHGNKCEIPCPAGLYGFKCSSSCKCPNCRPTDGYCPCQPGWSSPLCQGYCPETYFDLALNLCVESKDAGKVKWFENRYVIPIISIIIASATVCFILVAFLRYRKKRGLYTSLRIVSYN